jgi:NADH-quinone oxidoreductase subunit I
MSLLGTGILKGMAVTAKNFVGSYYDPERLTTVQYPEEKVKVQENFRNFPFLVFDADPDKGIRCVACKICEDDCPPQCIYIERETDEKGKPVPRPRVFDIDISVCMGCQICVEVCPFEAIKMDQEYEYSDVNRFEGLLHDKNRLLKSNEYYHKLHPKEATEVDAKLAAKKKKPAAPAAKPAAKPAAPAPKPAAAPAMAKIVIPDDAPFNPEQRAWLSGFLSSVTIGGAAANAPIGAATAPVPTAEATAPAETATEAAPAAEGDVPWHDQSLELDQRMKLAEGRPLEDKLMAAMAQLDCGACGYDCRGYSAAIVTGQEKDLTLCAPGEKPTADKVVELMKGAGKI